MRIRYAATAAIELEETLAYLRNQSAQVVRRFRYRVREAEQGLLDLPGMGRPTGAGAVPIRRVRLRPFPYLLFYQVAEDEILVVGIRHGARDPATMPGAVEV